MPIRIGQQITSKEILGMSAIPDTTAYLSLTNAYQDLVAAPANGTRLVSQIVLSNDDSSLTGVFYFKLVKSGVDYIPVQIALAPGERLSLYFPILLDNTVKIQAKTSVSLAGRALACYSPFYGGYVLNNLTGAGSFATIYTQGSIGNQIAVNGLIIQNTYASTQTIEFQVIDGSSNVKLHYAKQLQPGASWFLGLKTILSYNWSLQIKAPSSVTCSAYLSYIPADMP